MQTINFFLLIAETGADCKMAGVEKRARWGEKEDKPARRLCCCSRLFSTVFVRCTTPCAGGTRAPLFLLRWEMIVSGTDY
jgi:hypothetical protein